MKGTAAKFRNGILVGAFLTVFCLVLMLMVSRAAVAEVRNVISTPDAVQYGEGDGLDGSASDAAITASQAFQDSGGGSASDSAEGGSPSPETSSADTPDGTIETSPVSEKEAYTGEAAREAGITELPHTGGASPASLLGGVLVAGGVLVRLASRGISWR